MLTKRQKRLRMIGRHYEHSVAMSLKLAGYLPVNERGFMGLYDEGIDIIAIKDGKPLYAQCKGWSVRRHLHENTVDQLYGSVVYQVGKENISNVELCIYSPCPPTDVALKHATKLGVRIVQQSYPVRTRKKQSI